MITLAIINFCLSFINSFIVNHLSNLLSPLTAIGTYISAFQVPQTVLDIYAVVCYFLPIGTIGVLLGFTGLLIIAKFILACVHFLPSLIFGS